jgi:hypothetical protein
MWGFIVSLDMRIRTLQILFSKICVVNWTMVDHVHFQQQRKLTQKSSNTNLLRGLGA